MKKRINPQTIWDVNSELARTAPAKTAKLACQPLIQEHRSSLSLFSLQILSSNQPICGEVVPLDTLSRVQSGMEVVAGARIAFPQQTKVNVALYGTSEYERDFNYSSGLVRRAEHTLDRLATVSPEAVAAH